MATLDIDPTDETEISLTSAGYVLEHIMSLLKWLRIQFVEELVDVNNSISLKISQDL